MSEEHKNLINIFASGGIDKAYKLFDALVHDVKESQKGTIPSPTSLEAETSIEVQFKRRQYVRTSYAMCEGLIYSLKIMAKNGLASLTHEEFSLCEEKITELKDNGEIVSRKAQLRFIPNLRYSFIVFAKSFNSEALPDYSVERFEKFRLGVSVRDRLMHPKSVDDLNISIAEIAAIAEGMAWFMTSYQLATGAAFDILKVKLAQVKGAGSTPTAD